MLSAHSFNRLLESKVAADQWVAVYNKFLPHESLGHIQAAEFRP